MRWAVRLAVVACSVAPAPADASQVLFAAEDNGPQSKLYRVDPATGATQLVGTAGMSLNSIAIRPSDGAMFGMSANHFVTVDKATGAATMTAGTVAEDTMDLAFTPEGTLFGWLEHTSDDLVRYDPVTYTTTPIGEAGIDALAPSLAADGTGALYFADADNGALSTVNSNTSALTVAATLQGDGNGYVIAMAFDAAGTLFGVRELGGVTPVDQLVTIDRSTGAIAVRGELPYGTDAIAFDRPTADTPPDTGGGPQDSSGGSVQPGGESQQPPSSQPAGDTTAPRCIVPKLRHKQLKAAKRALKRAHCRLGKVTRRHARRSLRGRVLTQRPKPGVKRAAGTKVALVLGRR